MQELEIKDVQSGATYRIAAQGSVIGREGAKADIIIKNPSVSKRHARIYATDGQWFLEDLGSSNGTFFANQRINEPVPLGPGTLFALAEIQFEVVKKGGANGEERGGRGGGGGGRDRLRAETAARPDDGEVIGSPTARPNASRNSLPAGGDEDELATGVGAIMSVIPRAFAHYLVAVPKLALNPIGTVRTSVEEQRHPAMSWWSLAGWGIPPMLLSAAIAVLVSVIAMVVAGAFVVGTLINVIITPAIMIAVALVMALIWHPVLEWVIRKLKGNSDARSRSNYFVIVMTAMALAQIVTGLTGLFALIPVPFIAVAPALLAIVASLISLYVSYVWVRFFEMHKIIPILVLIGMALTGITGLLGVFNIVSAGGAVVAGGGGGSGGAAIPADAQAAIDKARADAEKAIAEASKAAGSSAEDMKAADEKVKAALAAGAKAAASDDAAKAKAEAAAENVGREAKVKEDLEKQKAEEARAEVEKAKATAEKAAAEAEKAKAAEKAAAEKAAAEKSAEAGKAAPIEDDDPPARPSGGYGAWAAKRDAVEKAIKDDPTLLRRKDVLGLYETYTRVEYDVRKSYNSKRNKNEPWRDKIIERNIAADTYDRTRDTIEKLHAALF